MDTNGLREAYEKLLNKLYEKMRGVYSGIAASEQASKYIKALLSSVERKNGWQLAEAQGEKTPYKVQQFIYRGVWKADDLRDAVRNFVIDEIAEEDSVLVMDDTGFLKKGVMSAGVKRQYTGTAGRIENCQIGVFLTYANRKGFTLVDRKLYLPEEWAYDDARRKKAGIPEEIEFETKPAMALCMLERAKDMPFSWVTGDCAYNAGYIRNWVEEKEKSYVLALSPKDYVWQGNAQRRVADILGELTDEGWTRISCGEGTKGDRIYDYKAVAADPPLNPDFERCVLVRRSLSDPKEISAFLCFYRKGTPLKKLVEISGIRWTVERSFQESKGEVGLDQYEFRSYAGWHKHITLSMCALALLAVLKNDVADVGQISPYKPDESTTGSLDGFKKGRNL